MTYHCGTSGLAPIGIPNDTPRIVCDGCGIVYRIKTDRPPPSWFLDGKAPPKWRKVIDGSIVSGTRRDYCPRCKV